MSRGHQFVDELDYYDDSEMMVGKYTGMYDNGSHLLRELVESSDWYVTVDKETKQVIKAIRRRDPENNPVFTKSEETEVVPNHGDAMDKGRWESWFEDSGPTVDEDGNEWIEDPAPVSTGDQWDLICDETRKWIRCANCKHDVDVVGENKVRFHKGLDGDKCPTSGREVPEEYIQCFSAYMYPARVSHRYTREMQLLIKLVLSRRISGGQLYQLASKLPPKERKRIWEMYKIEKFLTARKEGK